MTLGMGAAGVPEWRRVALAGTGRCYRVFSAGCCGELLGSNLGAARRGNAGVYGNPSNAVPVSYRFYRSREASNPTFSANSAVLCFKDLSWPRGFSRCRASSAPWPAKDRFARRSCEHLITYHSKSTDRGPRRLHSSDAPGMLSFGSSKSLAWRSNQLWIISKARRRDVQWELHFRHARPSVTHITSV